MKKLFIALLLLSACTRDPSVNSDDDKVLYTLGVELGKNIRSFELSEKELELVALGLKESARKQKLKVEPAHFMQKLTELSVKRSREAALKETTASDAYLKDLEKQPGMENKHGFLFKEITAGKGKVPSEKDRVKVHYEGKLRDGSVFDSSISRGQPAVFPVTGVIPCWTKALQLMKVGGKMQIHCPPSMAYGERGSPPVIPGGAALSFEIELIGIEKKN